MLSLLDKSVRTAKWHGKPLPETIKASVKEVLNGDFVLTFIYPMTDSGLYKELKEDYLIRSPVPVLGHQLFRIKKVIEGDSKLEVVAYHISDDIMTRLLSPFRCEQVPCGVALSQMVMASSSSLGDFSFSSDVTKHRTYTSDKEQTLYAALLDGKHSLVGTWEGELVRDNLALAIKAHRGEDRGVIISSHFNLKSYQRTKESSSIITRIHATSRFKAEGQDEESTLRVTVDSPMINHYPFINEVTYTNNNLKTPEALRAWASNKFRLEGIDKPKDAIVIEAFELDGQTVHLGDTVTLKSKAHGIDMSNKAIAYDYDPLAKNYRSITFDDKASIGTGKTGGSLTALANNLIDGNRRSEDVSVAIALENANRAFGAEFEKRRVAIDDAIEQAQSHGEVYANRLKAGIDKDILALRQAMRTNDEAYQRTSQDLRNRIGANNHLATEAKQKAEEASIGLATALRRVEESKNQAISEARRLDTVERQATETQLATAKRQAVAEAQGLVDQAKHLLESQVLSAKTLLTETKQALGSQLTSLNTEVTKTNEVIKTLARKSDITDTNQRVTSMETSLTQQAGQLTLKANKSDVSSLHNRLNRAESSLNLQAGQIALKASQSDVDGVSSRLASAETSLRVQSDQLSQRVTTSVFDQEKARLSRAESTISQLGDRITREIRTVDSQIPKDYGTANLLKNSSFLSDTKGWVNNGLTQEAGHLVGVGGFGQTLMIYQEIAPLVVDDKESQVYTLSADLKVENLVLGTSNPFLQLYISGSRQNGQWFGASYRTRPDFMTLNNQGWVRAHSQFSLDIPRSDLKRCAVHLYLRDYTGRVSVRRMKLTKGDLKTDWSPAPDDVQGHLSLMETRLRETSSGLEQVSSRLRQESDKVTRAETQIRHLLNDVSSKVSQTDFNRMQSSLQEQATSLRQTQSSLILKADKTVTDSLRQSTQQLSSDLRVAQDGIKQKVSQQDFNAARGRISQAESRLETLSNHITTKVSRTDVNQMVDGKGFVTSNTLSTTISQTADALNTRISRVEGQVPRELGGVNLLTNSSLTENHTGWVNRGGRLRSGDDPAYVFEVSSPQNVSLSQHLKAMIGEDRDEQVYTYSFEVKIEDVVSGSLLIYFGGYEDKTWKNGDYLSSRYFHQFPKGEWRRFSGQCQLPNKSALRTIEFWLYGANFQGRVAFRHVKLERGALASDWTPALEDLAKASQLNEVRDTVSEHTRTLTDQGNAISQVTQRATGIASRVLSLEVNRATKTALDAVETVVSQVAGSWSVRNLTSSGSILSQLNLNKDGSVRIDGRLIHITGRTIIEDGVISSAKIASLDAGKLTSGLISAARIGSEAITADKLKVDQAFFNKFMASEAYLRQVFAKSAFISQVQAVTLSASQISGGILAATNGAMKLNLSQGHIKFYTNSPSISREVPGYPHQWVSFETGTSNGRPCGVTVIGSNRWKNWNANDGGFVGIRAWNGEQDDQIDIVGDKVRLASAPFTNPDGWDIVTLPNQLAIDAHRAADRPSSKLSIGDVRLYRTSSNYVSLKDVLHQFNHNFKHLVNITGRGDVLLTWDTIK